LGEELEEIGSFKSESSYDYAKNKLKESKKMVDEAVKGDRLNTYGSLFEVSKLGIYIFKDIVKGFSDPKVTSEMKEGVLESVLESLKQSIYFALEASETVVESGKEHMKKLNVLTQGGAIVGFVGAEDKSKVKETTLDKGAA